MARKPPPDSHQRRKVTGAARFALLFALCFIVGIGVVLSSPIQLLDESFSRALVNISHGVIGTCGGVASVQGAILRAPSGFGVEMKDGCNGVNVTILLWSAIIAFPAPGRMKALGVLTGTVAIQLVNVVRFISLFYLGQYSTNWFEFAHTYLWETLLILDTLVIFWFWVNRVCRAPALPDARN